MMRVVDRIITTLLAVSAILIISSIFLPLATMKGDVSVMGRKIEFDAVIYPYKADYSVNAKAMNTSRSGTLVFYRGMRSGGFGDAAALLKGSKKNFSYYIEAEGFEGEKAKVYVNTSASMVPWLPYGMKERCRIFVDVAERRNISRVVLESVRLEIWWDYKWDPAEDRYVYTKYKVVWESTINEEISDTRSFDIAIRVPRDLGDRIGIIGKAKVSIYSKSGGQLISMMNIPESKAPPIEINVYPLSAGQTFNILMFVTYIPFSAAYSALVAYIVYILYKKGWEGAEGGVRRVVLCALMLVLISLASLGIRSSILTMAGLIGFEKYVNFTAYYYIALASMLLGYAGLILALIKIPAVARCLDRIKAGGKN